MCMYIYIYIYSAILCDAGNNIRMQHHRKHQLFRYMFHQRYADTQRRQEDLPRAMADNNG